MSHNLRLDTADGEETVAVTITPITTDARRGDAEELADEIHAAVLDAVDGKVYEL